jgi:hypothetical protein
MQPLSKTHLALAALVIASTSVSVVVWNEAKTLSPHLERGHASSSREDARSSGLSDPDPSDFPEQLAGSSGRLKMAALAAAALGISAGIAALTARDYLANRTFHRRRPPLFTRVSWKSAPNAPFCSTPMAASRSSPERGNLALNALQAHSWCWIKRGQNGGFRNGARRPSRRSRARPRVRPSHSTFGCKQPVTPLPRGTSW